MEDARLTGSGHPRTELYECEVCERIRLAEDEPECRYCHVWMVIVPPEED